MEAFDFSYMIRILLWTDGNMLLVSEKSSFIELTKPSITRPRNTITTTTKIPNTIIK